MCLFVGVFCIVFFFVVVDASVFVIVIIAAVVTLLFPYILSLYYKHTHMQTNKQTAKVDETHTKCTQTFT